MNSLLQTVFNVPRFRGSILASPLAAESGGPLGGLRRVFEQLREGGGAASTRALTVAMDIDPR
jgi:hypothetical protein